MAEILMVVRDFEHYLVQLRRPLSEDEQAALRALYIELRQLVRASESEQVDGARG